MNYKIKTANKEELKIMVEWAAAEGWNPGLDDIEAFYAADNNGFLIGYLDDEPVSSISIVKYSADFAFLGFYIVKPEHRGKRFGIEIWNEAMKYASGCNIGLDGVIAQQDKYKLSGFKLAYRNIRFELNSKPEPFIDSRIRNLKDFPFDRINHYDKKLFLTDRNKFLCRWLYSKHSHAKALVENNEIKGYGVIRECRNGYKIGPLFAESGEYAEILFRALLNKQEKGKPVFFDVPEVNKSALELTTKYNMHPVFETARMYTGEFPALQHENIYGVTSFELG